MIRSKFKTETISNYIFRIIASTLLVIFNIRGLHKVLEGNLSVFEFVGITLFFVFLIAVSILSDIDNKLIILKNNKIIYWNLYFPIKNKIELNNLKGCIKRDNFNSDGFTYFFFNEKNIICFTLNEDFYENSKELLSRLDFPLLENFENNILKDFKLRTFGRLEIKQIEKYTFKNQEKTIYLIFNILVFLGLISLIFTLIFKML